MHERLQVLNIANNSLGGAVHDIVKNMTRALNITLSHNSFTGTVPDTLDVAQLLYFGAMNNDLEGQVPDSLVSLFLL